MAAAAASFDPSAEIKISVHNNTDDEEDIRVIRVIQRAQWLRAAILGANDGLLSTTSLMLGVGAAKEDKWLMIISGLAGAVSGACSMAVGEFVSVSTQREIEKKTLIMDNDKCNYHSNDHSDSNNMVMKQPQQHSSLPVVEGNNNNNNNNLQNMISSSPVAFTPTRSPFMKVVTKDKNMEEIVLPNPYKAAGASGLAFLCGSLFPLLSAIAFPGYKMRVVGIVVVTSVGLAVFGGVGARLGGSPVRVSAMRVMVGGWFSMALTYGLLKALDTDDRS